MNFDMNACWARAVELVRSNFQLLVVIAGVFVLLPSIATYLFVPDIQMFLDPTADREALAEKLAEIAGPVIGFGALSLAVQLTGYGAMVALMGDARPTVGQALGTGAKTVPSLFVVLIIFMLLYVLGGFLIALPISLIVGAAGVPALGLVGIFPVILFVLWLMARMSLVMPTLVLGGTLNPFKGIAGSFRLTRKSQWMILIFWVVLGAIFVLISLLLTGVFSLIAAVFGGGTTSLLILGIANGMLGMVSGVMLCAIAVAMYGQLSGPSAKNVAETFE
ncbi:hypothetical protein CD351_05085 [Erythrobacter sp. KY5]|uniref:hypothetical protein n=1 Tax=Erythrobacter sp. KY5 TaxID=2011159 RepID=UPI000DBEFA86|nr:hypothetical protein [Erythrobacter sp. KY5]AWW73797.1 hypothetical protein CD351_05085 [Erythrobacter sp. KY5]